MPMNSSAAPHNTASHGSRQPSQPSTSRPRTTARNRGQSAQANSRFQSEKPIWMLVRTSALESRRAKPITPIR